MMKMTIPKLATMLMLTLIMALLFMTDTTALAHSDGDPAQMIEEFRVEDIRLSGDKLSITITDKDTGLIHDLEIDLFELTDATGEYIIVPLGEITGNDSDTVMVRNPFFIHAAESVHNPDADEPGVVIDDYPFSEDNPFTHDGTATVIDNATDGDGKEFFAFETPEGNVFYLVVDRQRMSENVYFLNAVTEHDLYALAVPGDGRPVVPETPEPPVIEIPEETPEPEPESGDSDSGTLIFIAIAVIAIGAAGYYFKIVRPKKNAYADDDDYDDEDETQDDDSDDDDESEDF
ncbi:MAG: DUF4366 domain-containing protein [Oscillospiraceae bacterium]|nr:DUF4366 domain-containing protein [Oscillospiraceae bacterium]MCL2279749.1 DUF4366 domain-containing protein [Oscillospiraceae bacterium]